MSQQEPSVNERIRALRVLVIDEEGNKIGVMMTRDALAQAREKGLDLVEVAPGTEPPVARIMDYGKYLYTQQKKSRDARKKQAQQQVKEIKLRTKTEDHDLQTKLRKAKEFLEDGDRVKVHVMYRGREMAHPELGRTMMAKVVKELEDWGIPIDHGEMMGRALVTVIQPLTKSQIAQRLKAKEQAKAAEAALKEGA